MAQQHTTIDKRGSLSVEVMERSSSCGRRFLSKWGYWYLDEENITIQHGVVPYLKHQYNENRIAFYLIVLFSLYCLLAIIVDDREWLRRSFGLLLGGGSIVMIVVIRALLFVFRHFTKASSASKIRISNVEFVEMGRIAGSTILMVHFTQDGEELRRQIPLPTNAGFDVESELSRVQEGLESKGIEFRAATKSDSEVE